MRIRTTLFRGLWFCGLMLLLAPGPASAGEAPSECPSPKIQSDIAASAGFGLGGLQNAVAFVEHLYGPPHSLRQASGDEVRLVYKSDKGAVQIGLRRDIAGEIQTDCIVY